MFFFPPRSISPNSCIITHTISDNPTSTTISQSVGRLYLWDQNKSLQWHTVVHEIFTAWNFHRSQITSAFTTWNFPLIGLFSVDVYYKILFHSMIFFFNVQIVSDHDNSQSSMHWFISWSILSVWWNVYTDDNGMTTKLMRWQMRISGRFREGGIIPSVYLNLDRAPL